MADTMQNPDTAPVAAPTALDPSANPNANELWTNELAVGIKRPERKQSLFVYAGKVYRIPETALYHNFGAVVSVDHEFFAANLSKAAAHAWNIDSFMSSVDETQSFGYSATQVAVVETKEGWVWASRCEIELDPALCASWEFPQTAKTGHGVGGSFLWPWHEYKALRAWENAAETSRLDGRNRPLVQFEPTTRILEIQQLTPDIIPGCVEVANEELTREQRFFLMNISPLGSVVPPRFSHDNYGNEVSEYVRGVQALAKCRQPHPSGGFDVIIPHLLSGKRHRGHNNNCLHFKQKMAYVQSQSGDITDHEYRRKLRAHPVKRANEDQHLPDHKRHKSLMDDLLSPRRMSSNASESSQSSEESMVTYESSRWQIDANKLSRWSGDPMDEDRLTGGEPLGSRWDPIPVPPMNTLYNVPNDVDFGSRMHHVIERCYHFMGADGVTKTPSIVDAIGTDNFWCVIARSVSSAWMDPTRESLVHLGALRATCRAARSIVDTLSNDLVEKSSRRKMLTLAGAKDDCNMPDEPLVSYLTGMVLDDSIADQHCVLRHAPVCIPDTDLHLDSTQRGWKWLCETLKRALKTRSKLSEKPRVHDKAVTDACSFLTVRTSNRRSKLGYSLQRQSSAISELDRLYSQMQSLNPNFIPPRVKHENAQEVWIDLF